MKEWTYTSKQGTDIVVSHARINDARDMHKSFCEVVEEGLYLPTFSPNSTVPDWIDWIQRCIGTRELLLVAKISNKYAGHLTLQPEEWVASRHVSRLGVIVQKDMRNIGIGKSLMIAAEEAALELRYEKITLSTFDNNEIALALYKKLGYKTVGTRVKHFKMSVASSDGYIGEILMEKLLSE